VNSTSTTISCTELHVFEEDATIFATTPEFIPLDIAVPASQFPSDVLGNDRVQAEQSKD
jgi:hypothetical protein